MLSRFVRIQLVIFTIASVVGVSIMVVNYLQLPTMLGIGRMSVTVELPNSGGLYRFANVTYRGVQVGKVSAVLLDPGPPTHTKARLTLDSSVKIPAALTAEVHSISAIGEQYVDLVPHTDAPPYLQDGSVVAMTNTTVPQQVGPMLDQTSALLSSVPKDKFNALLDETFTGLNGAGFDLGSLADSTSRLTGDLNAVADRTQALIDDSAPLLDAQAASNEALRTWSRSLAGVTTQLVDNDPQIRTLFSQAPAAADEISALLSQIKPTLPVLLANLTTIGQITITYNPSLEQVLVLLPPFISTIQAAMPRNNATGIPTGGEFAITAGDPNPCTVGFLPPSQWRSPADLSDIDTPDGLYCKLPQDSPTTVRGARNYPCMAHPGKRAPTVRLCNDPDGFQPLAARPHILGPYPFDPNLIAQGIPPDSRVTRDENIFGPATGTPLPPVGVPAAGTSPEPPALPPPPAPENAPVQEPATPSSAHQPGLRTPGFGVAQYNPRTGTYLGGDGAFYTQVNLDNTRSATTWTDLLPH
ncbi:virulence factor Mce [Mycobacterium sp. GA-1199]|uniref:MCE family protein n=1 Tax=Mycobacterium sp. GA-1199 TaxID=1772287 RepID=UPI0007483140|nr:MlaD family protein [Mycobacterium sp. GA-1199]KUI43566.1 virulence factor Mce [Mycobacterium sp. GA-1199]